MSVSQGSKILASDCVSTNTANTLVLRDGSGNFSAGTITASLTGTASKATAANLTTTANAIAYYTNTTGTFGTKASANGALYATSANGALSWGTLPVAQGGTGATSFTASSVIVSGSTTTSALTTRGIYTLSAVGNTGWDTTANRTKIPDMSFMAYWNGAYSGNSSNITKLGTISSGTWNATTIGVGYGGTGKTSWTQWGVLYASASTTLTNTTAGTAGYLLQGNGAAAPSWIQATDSNTGSTIVKRDSSGNFSAGTITATSIYSTRTDGPSLNHNTTQNNWAYIRLQSGTSLWDIAVNSSRSGKLEFRPSGVDPATWIDASGILNVYNYIKCDRDIGLLTSAGAAQAVKTLGITVSASYAQGTSPCSIYIYRSNTSVVQLVLTGHQDMGFSLYSYNDAGTMTARLSRSSGVLQQVSSRKVKKDIQLLNTTGDQIDKLKPVSFKYINGDNSIQFGLIYEDTVNILPEICVDAEGSKTITYTELIPVLLKEIQSLRRRTRDLETQLSFLTQPNILPS